MGPSRVESSRRGGRCMRRYLAIGTVFLFLGCIACTASEKTNSDGPAIGRVLATGFADPWEISWGPDDFLWVTEKTGKRVVRVNPSDGSKHTVSTIADVYESGGQDGLLGMAFHPGMLKGKGTDYVYLAYTYDADRGVPVDRRAKIARYTYDTDAGTLSTPVDVISGLPASSDHNAGRLLIGPDQKIYYSIGDQGNNQFERFCEPIRAQDLPSAEEVAGKNWKNYVGKILRISLDGSVPDDNPVLAGVRSHVYSYGHRNPQALVFGPGGRLFSAEHGPKSDDEINLIRAGKNYGWPAVVGFQDDQSYVYANWSAATSPPCAGLSYDSYVVPPAVPQHKESAWHAPNFVEPLKTLYTVPNGYNFQDPACGDQFYICWPSTAPSSTDYLPAGAGGLADWRNVLVMTSLKNGSVYVFRLTGDGGSVQGDVMQFFKTTNRYRDLALRPDGRVVYVITDSSGLAGPQIGLPTVTLDNPGAILVFENTE
ncbi:MAG: glucose/sorbosone family PQQ-dependent dehydrogenase [Pseudonocardiaceae bacterium]